MRLGLGIARISLAVGICCDFTLVIQARQSTQVGGAANTSTSSFHHRALQESIVAGDYLYIDGGEITTWDGQDGSPITVKESNTFSIDLTVSWTNGSVSLNTISKGNAPIVNTGALWMGPGGETFFSYDGGLGLYVDLSTDPPSPNELWQFIPDGAAGAWLPATFPPSSNFSTLTRTTDGIYASGNGLGFALGGHVDRWTVAGAQIPFNVSGMVIYNLTSQQWYNISSTGYSFESGISEGQGLFVPSFGPAGLLFVFGGIAGNSYATFDYAYMYEPISQQWKWQRTGGNIPAGVTRPCAVGVDSGNGTYEIFLYGGLAGDFATSAQATSPHVLSLPSFFWQRRDVGADYSRDGHSCNVVGNKQMAIIGGTVSSAQQYAIADPWTNGIGIFDLSDMEWKDSYNANAGPYVTPEFVKAHNNQNPYPDKWSDPVVESWFTQKAQQNQSASSSSTNDSHSDSRRSNVGAIAGGTVGGLITVALLATLVVFVRRSQRRETEDRKEDRALPSEADGVSRFELAAKERPKEADGVPMSELAAEEHSVPELPGN